MARGVKGTGRYSKYRYTKQEAKLHNFFMWIFCLIVLGISLMFGK